MRKFLAILAVFAFISIGTAFAGDYEDSGDSNETGVGCVNELDANGNHTCGDNFSEDTGPVDYTGFCFDCGFGPTTDNEQGDEEGVSAGTGGGGGNNDGDEASEED